MPYWVTVTHLLSRVLPRLHQHLTLLPKRLLMREHTWHQSTGSRLKCRSLQAVKLQQVCWHQGQKHIWLQLLPESCLGLELWQVKALQTP